MDPSLYMYITSFLLEVSSQPLINAKHCHKFDVCFFFFLPFNLIGIQAIQEREGLRNRGPNTGLISGSRTSRNVHSTGSTLHSRESRPASKHGSCDGDSVKETTMPHGRTNKARNSRFEIQKKSISRSQTLCNNFWGS